MKFEQGSSCVILVINDMKFFYTEVPSVSMEHMFQVANYFCLEARWFFPDGRSIYLL